MTDDKKAIVRVAALLLVGLAPAIASLVIAPSRGAAIGAAGSAAMAIFFVTWTQRLVADAHHLRLRESALRGELSALEATVETQGRELREARTHDAATGVLNRAAFLRRLEETISRDSRSAKSVAFLLVDIEGFKAINAERGRSGGDATLKRVAAPWRTPPAERLRRALGRRRVRRRAQRLRRSRSRGRPYLPRPSNASRPEVAPPSTSPSARSRSRIPPRGRDAGALPLAEGALASVRGTGGSSMRAPHRAARDGPPRARSPPRSFGPGGRSILPRVTSTFEAVRKACSPQLWSRGIELVRAEAVIGERADADEVAVRVATRGGMIARSVRLFLDDAQWECTCGAAVCEHAAAAVIAVKRAHDEGRALPTPTHGSGTIAYRFLRGAGGLAVERGVQGRRCVPRVRGDARGALVGRVPGPPFTARQADLTAELALSTHRRGPVPRAIVDKLMRALSGCDDVALDGVPVRTSADPVGPRVAVEDQGDGFRVVLEDDPEISEVFQNGITRCGDTLRPSADPKLTGKELHEFSAGRHFGPSEWNDLVTEVLPALRGRVAVDLRTSRLPVIERMPPRIAIETRRDGAALTVLAVLVYGDPPQARVDGGKLVHLGGALPLATSARSSGRSGISRRDSASPPGVPTVVTGPHAVALAAKLSGFEGDLQGGGREASSLRAR
jgi:hypothetical protein